MNAQRNVRESVMTQKTAKELLEGAYALGSAKDNVDYYADFAAVYDEGFASDLGYQSPRMIAEYLAEVGSDAMQIADIGCGTGLIADHLPGHQIDGYDISPEMIEVAREKGLYREFYCADLTGDLSALPDDYDALISAGTFTMGHLDAGHLLGLLALLKHNAWVAVTISQAHFDKAGFGDALNAAFKNGLITKPELREFSIYQKARHDHSSDKGWLTRFQKA